MSSEPPYTYDLSARVCEWCGATNDDGTFVTRCPSCDRYSCVECMYLFDAGMTCKHLRPDERGVLTRQDWAE